MQSISVILVEPQAIFLHGVEHDLEKSEDIIVVGTATNGTKGLRLIESLRPDVVVTPLQSEGGIDLESAELEQSRVMILTADETEDAVLDCVLLGAQGYLLKWNVVNFAESIRRLHNGEIVMCSRSLQAFVNTVRRRQAKPESKQRRPDETLTPRERQVLEMVGVGGSYAEIADALNIAVPTVKTHMRNTYSKLQVKRSAAAVQRALEMGLIDRRRNGD